MYFSYVMQHVKRGDFASEINCEFLFDVAKLFSALKGHLMYQKLVKEFKFYNWKWSKILIFLTIFWRFSSIFKKADYRKAASHISTSIPST